MLHQRNESLKWNTSITHRLRTKGITWPLFFRLSCYITLSIWKRSLVRVDRTNYSTFHIMDRLIEHFPDIPTLDKLCQHTCKVKLVWTDLSVIFTVKVKTHFFMTADEFSKSLPQQMSTTEIVLLLFNDTLFFFQVFFFSRFSLF